MNQEQTRQRSNHVRASRVYTNSKRTADAYQRRWQNSNQTNHVERMRTESVRHQQQYQQYNNGRQGIGQSPSKESQNMEPWKGHDCNPRSQHQTGHELTQNGTSMNDPYRQRNLAQHYRHHTQQELGYRGRQNMETQKGHNHNPRNLHQAEQSTVRENGTSSNDYYRQGNPRVGNLNGGQNRSNNDPKWDDQGQAEGTADTTGSNACTMKMRGIIGNSSKLRITASGT